MVKTKIFHLGVFWGFSLKMRLFPKNLVPCAISEKHYFMTVELIKHAAYYKISGKKTNIPNYIKIVHEFFQIWYEEKFEVPPLNLSILRNMIP